MEQREQEEEGSRRTSCSHTRPPLSRSTSLLCRGPLVQPHSLIWCLSNSENRCVEKGKRILQFSVELSCQVCLAVLDCWVGHGRRCVEAPCWSLSTACTLDSCRPNRQRQFYYKTVFMALYAPAAADSDDGTPTMTVMMDEQMSNCFLIAVHWGATPHYRSK